MSNLCPHSSSNHALVQPFHIQAEDGVRVRDFWQLRELELGGNRLSPPHLVLLPSITSLELRKIIFSIGSRGGWDVLARLEDWASVDEQLCELVDRLRMTGYCHTLEVELRLNNTGDITGKYEFTKFLSKFREKGIVTVVDAFQGHRILHSFAHSH